MLKIDKSFQMKEFIATFSKNKISQLLTLEYLKWKSNAVITMLIILFTALFPFIILTAKDMFANVPPPLPSSAVFFEFPTVWDYQGYVGNWMLFFFIGFLGIFIITNEISYKTLRQNIITGLTRTEYFAGKLLTILVIALVTTVLYALSTIIIGLIHTDGVDFQLVFDNNWAILRFFLMSMGYLSFGMMIGIVVRGGGVATFLYLSYILFIESIIKWATFSFINSDTIKAIIGEGGTGDKMTLSNVVNYLPMNVIEDLHPNPWLRLPDNFMKVSKEIDFDILIHPTTAIVLSFGYILLFLFLGYRSLMTRDI